MQRCQLPLLGADDQPARYQVTLHFAELDDVQPGQRVFDVKLQGETVESALDVAEQAGGSHRSLTRRFRDVLVHQDLAIELTPVQGQPILNAIEVQRQMD